MNRHGYSNGYHAHQRQKEKFDGLPHRFHPRPRASVKRRRARLLKLGLAAGLLFLVIYLLSPSLFGAASLFTASVSSAAIDDHSDVETVRYYDLSDTSGSALGWERKERILLLSPLRDAEKHLNLFFSHLKNLTYPHNLIDLAFLVGDSKDNTLDVLSAKLSELQQASDPAQQFGEISVIEKDFGQKVEQDVESRHGFQAQASRRKSMAQARNWLLSAALRPVHSWVYWRDVDVESAPFTILEDLMRHNKDVIVPNVWRPLPDWLGGEQPYDLNSWQDSDTALELARTLDEDAVIVEGYAEFATWRPHLAYLRDPFGDPDMEMDLDGVGGVSILAKASVFRAGVHFPAFSFERHAETEGFGKMARRMQFTVVGLPHYTIWHLYEPSLEDIAHMAELEQKREAQMKLDAIRDARLERVKKEFAPAGNQWDIDRAAMEVLKVKDEKEKAEKAKVEKDKVEKEPAEKEPAEKTNAKDDTAKAAPNP